MKEQDKINPNYYKIGGIQPYEYLKMKLTPEQYEGWLLGDAMVYLSRYGYKHNSESERLEDLKKARGARTVRARIISASPAVRNFPTKPSRTPIPITPG